MSKIITIKKTTIGDGQAAIALPLTPKSIDELKDALPSVKEAKPDIVEWRLDYLDNWQDWQLLQAGLAAIEAALPETVLIATFRTKAEGGLVAIDDQDYEQLLRFLTSQKVDIIDLEIRKQPAMNQRIIGTAHAAGKKIIASAHDFDKTPKDEELNQLFQTMASASADLLKVAVMAQTPSDVLRLMTISGKSARLFDQPIVSMAMGVLGTVTRLATNISQSAITFACLTKEQASAPGQVQINELRTIRKTLEGA